MEAFVSDCQHNTDAGFDEVADELRRVKEQLEVEIAERKRLEAEIEKAKKAAETAFIAKKRFLRSMNHEFRTPLTSILGFAELILDGECGEINEVQEEFVQAIHNSSHQLLHMVSNSLDFSIMTEGKLTLRRSDMNLKAFLQENLDEFRKASASQNMSLSLRIGSIPESINADENRLKQALYCLFSNAMKFTPDGGSIALSAFPVVFDNNESERTNSGGIPACAADHGLTAGRDMVEICVSDTGIGIKPEDVDRIFEPFEQADRSTKCSCQGAGLGLPIAKNIVELHGGNIWVETKGEGKGSAFRFVIPALGM